MTEKIRTYTNSDGMSIEVTKNHLDTAVHLKIELQNSVPSRKCNWKKHKQLMEQEGFYDSDTNEAYRCLIKDYQKDSGLLISMDKHLDLVTSGRLDAISSILGEIYEEKRENQLVLNEINKNKRELVITKVVSEEILDAFLDNIEINIPHYAFQPKLKSSANKAIVVLTDVHVGALIEDVYGNAYNYKIAKKRLSEYKRKVLEYCNCFGITEVSVCGLGDFVEHINMRYKQSESVEFKLSQQIVKATELIIDFLVGLAEYVNVEYSGIAGNHDRLQGDKDIAFDDDNANVIINNNISTFVRLSKPDRITYIETSDGATEINKVLNGKKFKLVHGHLDNGNKKSRMLSYISMQDEFFDCLIYGHLHHHDISESDNGRMTIGVGSVAGRNYYSKGFGAATDASQLMVVVTADGDVLPLRVGLQIV